MTATETAVPGINHIARAQALFDAVLRTRADVPGEVRIHCATAIAELGEPFAEVATARDLANDPVFDRDPAGAAVEAVLRAGLRELGRLSGGEFDRVFRAAEAGYDALSALR